MSISYSSCRNAHTAYGQSNHRRKRCHLCTGQWYETEEPSRVQEEYNPKEHGESAEKKLQSAINSVGEQSALLLMAVRDCVINKKSQAEIARKHGIPRRRVQ